MKFKKDPVLVVGDDKTAYSVAVCLLVAGHAVTLYTSEKETATLAVERHLKDLHGRLAGLRDPEELIIINDSNLTYEVKLAIIITPEDLAVKREVLSHIEQCIPEEALIAINMESYSLTEVANHAVAPSRVIGANWAEPAHTTFFLEVITNKGTPEEICNSFVDAAKKLWAKDPYVLRNDRGIRSRMISAMVREAFHLIENDYVSAEDIDRACRNDPGYYLPFAGHCRYMDLMGTYIYGLVMKDLNPELSKETHIPHFFNDLIGKGAEGMTNLEGIYKYNGDDVARHAEEFRRFSYEIQHLISKYPFNYLKESTARKKKVVSDL